ncbi:MAG TPA: stage II sporulation protein D [Candidatus Onthocola stercoravium]|nr:stage II sporulation protein D [Candidatus Onthocola stercoravium]
MQNKYLIIIIVVLSIIAIVSSPNKEETAYFNDDLVNVTVKDVDSNEETNLDLEEYVVGVVAGEMPASFEIEALKAQAIAARSYALSKIETSTESYDLVTDITNQVYITTEDMQEKWGEDYDFYYDKIKNAVSATKNLVMEYEGDVISAYYFAMSNGATEDVSLVFGESRDYLKSVDSSWDESVKNFSVTTTFTKEEFCSKLSIDCSNITIGAIDRSSTNRVNTIVINDKEFKGTTLRTLLGLRSTDFTIDIADDIKITTKGYGHGVGMSQYGANEMAKNGASYEEILNHYYKDIDIVEINV